MINIPEVSSPRPVGKSFHSDPPASPTQEEIAAAQDIYNDWLSQLFPNWQGTGVDVFTFIEEQLQAFCSQHSGNFSPQDLINFLNQGAPNVMEAFEQASEILETVLSIMSPSDPNYQNLQNAMNEIQAVHDAITQGNISSSDGLRTLISALKAYAVSPMCSYYKTLGDQINTWWNNDRQFWIYEVDGKFYCLSENMSVDTMMACCGINPYYTDWVNAGRPMPSPPSQ